MAVNLPKPPGDPQRLAGERALVSRRCLVCEWTGDLIERPGDDPDCPWCHGPTEPEPVSADDEAEAADALGKNPHAAALGRLGGMKGGRARAAALTPLQRRRIASRAARARWQKKSGEDGKF